MGGPSGSPAASRFNARPPDPMSSLGTGSPMSPHLLPTSPTLRAGSVPPLSSSPFNAAAQYSTVSVPSAAGGRESEVIMVPQQVTKTIMAPRQVSHTVMVPRQVTSTVMEDGQVLSSAALSESVV